MKKFLSLLIVLLFMVALSGETVLAYPRPLPPKPRVIKPPIVKPVIVQPAPVVPPPPAPVVTPPPPPPPAPVVIAPPPPAKKKLPVVKEPGAEIGVSGGYIAGTLGIGGELRINRLFDLPGITGRATGAYATDTKDAGGATRKNVLLGLDLILNLNPPATPGVRSYVGLGANYDVYTTGQTQGAIGGQAFVGAEGNLGGGEMFLEVGYGIIRPRVSDDRTGVNVLLGYKMGL